MEKRKRSKAEWIRRYVSFVFILFVIAFGTSLSIRANLGSSPISAPPYVLSLVPGMPMTDRDLHARRLHPHPDSAAAQKL